MTVFTREYANRTLPLVKAIVADILGEGRALHGFISRHGDASDSHEEYHKRNRRLKDFVEELEEIGCVYADYSFTEGTVHFPALFRDCEVFMIWQYGEDEILFYRGVREDEMVRHRIPPEYLEATDRTSETEVTEYASQSECA